MSYKFPKDDSKHFVQEMYFSIGDKTIRSKVMEKQQAQQVYDDNLAVGNAAILIQDLKEQEYYQIDLGNVLPSQLVKVKI